MDTFELNKIAGAILGSLLFVMFIGFVAELLYAPEELEQQAYVVEVEEEPEGEAAEEQEVPLANLLAEADAEAGARVARKCAACHNFEAGQPNKIGPNLHGVVGGEAATVQDFAYSDAMQEFAASGGTWTYENLFGYLANPKQWLPGNKMAFVGLRDPEERADAIAYLRTVSPDAPPLPEPEQMAESADETEAPDASETGDGSAGDGAATEGAEAAPGEPADGETGQGQ